MKIIAFVILTMIIVSCGQKTNDDSNANLSHKDSIMNAVKDSNIVATVSDLDSVIAVDEIFPSSPFPTKNIDFNYFKKRIKIDYKFTEVMQPFFSDQIDTFKVLKWGNSYVKAHMSDGGKSFYLIDLVISDTNFVFNKKIKIGQTAETIFKKFNVKFDKNKNYKFLQLETKDGAYSAIIFYFTNNILTSIDWDPYTG